MCAQSFDPYIFVIYSLNPNSLLRNECERSSLDKKNKKTIFSSLDLFRLANQGNVTLFKTPS